MSRDDIQKLLGGYATGTLTPEEQQALFEAALDDQELFDALAREQALRDLLRDSSAKEQLLEALNQRPARWYEGLVRGWRPLAAAVAMAGVGAIAVVSWQSARSRKPVLVAQVSAPPAAASPVSTPSAEPSPASPVVANPAQQPAAARDTNGPAMRDKDATRGRLAKDRPQTVAIDGASEEDRRVKKKPVAQAPERQDLADSVKEAPSFSKSNGTLAPLPPVPPISPGTVASGFREGAVPGGGGGNLGGVPRAPLPMTESKTAPQFRSATGNTAGVLGGLLPGVAGAKPDVAPPPPATPKGEAQPTQSAASSTAAADSAASQAKPAQSGPAQLGQQGQQGPASPSAQFQSGQSQATPQQLERARLAQTAVAAAETVQVTAAASLDAVSRQDPISLFYGNAADAFLVNGSQSGAAGVGGSMSGPPARAQKQPVEQAEKTQAGRQTMAVNTIARNTKAQTHRLNLGVRYSLLRKTAAGRFELVDPNSVKTGDTLELQLMPNDSGTLQVRERSGDGPWQDVMLHRVEALNIYTTRPLKSGETELQVTLMRVPVALAGVSMRDDKSAVSQQSTSEPATYVVAGPASPLLHFTISLNYK